MDQKEKQEVPDEKLPDKKVEKTEIPEPKEVSKPDPKPKSKPKAKPKPEPVVEEPGIFDGLYDTLFGKSWAMWIGCIILSVLSIGLFLISSPWGSSGGLLSWGQNIFDMIGMDLSESAPNGVTSLLDNRYGMLSVTMLIGALGAALMAKEFAIRIPPMGELGKGLAGGILMGIGAILGMGCTVGGFYSGWPALSGGALIFVLGLFIGTFIAVKYLLWEMEAMPKLSSGKSSTLLAAKTIRVPSSLVMMFEI